APQPAGKCQRGDGRRGRSLPRPLSARCSQAALPIDRSLAQVLFDADDFHIRTAIGADVTNAAHHVIPRHRPALMQTAAVSPNPHPLGIGKIEANAALLGSGAVSLKALPIVRIYGSPCHWPPPFVARRANAAAFKSPRDSRFLVCAAVHCAAAAALCAFLALMPASLALAWASSSAVIVAAGLPSRSTRQAPLRVCWR